MARYKRKRRKGKFIEVLKVQAQKVAEPSKNLLPLFLGVVLIVFAGKGGQSFLCQSPYFRILNLELQGDRELSGEEAELFLGLEQNRNLFQVNIRELSQNIQDGHPEFLSVKVERHLPDSLIVKVEERIPVAQIKSGRYFLIDREGFVLPQVRNFADVNLPLIIGLDNEKASIKTGIESELRGVPGALSLLEEIKSSPSFIDTRVKVIDASDQRNLSFLITDGIEVKIGETDFGKKLKLLANVLSELERGQSKPKYIDLRFGDPVIGTR